MQTAEIELKFLVEDLAILTSRLPGLGFLLDTPRTLERNTLYDTPTRTLRESKQILRLRQYGDVWTLAHKRQRSPTEDAKGRYKIRIETETHVDDGPALGTIFEALGFAPVFHYEKFRTVWSQRLARADWSTEESVSFGQLVTDETPIGIYAELEGPTAWIDRTLAALRVDPAACLTDSYGKLFLAWKQRTASPADHLTFDQIPTSVLLQQATR